MKRILIILLTILMISFLFSCQNPLPDNIDPDPDPDPNPIYITYTFSSDYSVDDIQISWDINGVTENFNIPANSSITKTIEDTDIISNILAENNAGFELVQTGDLTYNYTFTTIQVIFENESSRSYTQDIGVNLYDGTTGVDLSTTSMSIEANTIEIYRMLQSDYDSLIINRESLTCSEPTFSKFNVIQTDKHFDIYEFTTYLSVTLTNNRDVGSQINFIIQGWIQSDISYAYAVALGITLGYSDSYTFTITEDQFINQEVYRLQDVYYENLCIVLSSYDDGMLPNFDIYLMDRIHTTLTNPLDIATQSGSTFFIPITQYIESKYVNIMY